MFPFIGLILTKKNLSNNRDVVHLSMLEIRHKIVELETSINSDQAGTQEMLHVGLMAIVGEMAHTG